MCLDHVWQLEEPDGEMSRFGFRWALTLWNWGGMLEEQSYMGRFGKCGR
jgi:hypothetical protein